MICLLQSSDLVIGEYLGMIMMLLAPFGMSAKQCFIHSVIDQFGFILILVTFPWVKFGGESELAVKNLFKVFEPTFKSIICLFMLSKIVLGERKGIFILAVMRLQ